MFLATFYQKESSFIYSSFRHILVLLLSELFLLYDRVNVETPKQRSLSVNSGSSILFKQVVDCQKNSSATILSEKDGRIFVHG